MSDQRLNNQLTLAFPTEDRGEALRAVEGSVEQLGQVMRERLKLFDIHFVDRRKFKNIRKLFSDLK